TVIWDPRTRRQIGKVDGEEVSFALAFSPDDSRLALLSMYERVCVFNAMGKPEGDFNVDHPKGGLCWSGDMKCLGYLTNKGEFDLRDSKSGAEIRTIVGESGTFAAVAPYGQSSAVFGLDNGDLELWNLKSSQRTGHYDGTGWPISAMLVDGK